MTIEDQPSASGFGGWMGLYGGMVEFFWLCVVEIAKFNLTKACF